MIKKNFGPCSVVNCTNSNALFRKITEYAYQKCQETNILETYPYLEIGMQLCHPHYCKIVEFKHNHDKNKQKKNSKSDSLELEFQKFEKMIEETNSELKGFFLSMVNAIIPKE
ncbi:hypothetical protein Glove_166g240 [Diversispora epigaea]|uniref:Uncharacterized protein n=1 Tax=Diversispora epigaea TaxID=1348612 RepID=A0A397IQB0_9GLOM|nr:hypothetical protein Glove_166g240 [Diversispora epigaea]